MALRDGPAEPDGLSASSPVLRDIYDRFVAGDRRALARAISLVEDEAPGFQAFLHAVVGREGPPAVRVGVTGPPGAGKSTLVSALADRRKAGGEEVAVLAVDPTSPRSGGAILGDRVRMGRASEAGVFLRSMASRGADGGLATTTLEVLDLMDRFGFAHLLVETLGVGQSQTMVAFACDSVVLVLVPEAGDDIQAMKSGTLEIADILVVNKADRPGAERMASDLGAMVEMRREVGAGATDWDPPVLLLEAREGRGVSELDAALERHRRALTSTGGLEARRRARAGAQLEGVVLREARRAVLAAASKGWEERLDRILKGTDTPYSMAAEILDGVSFE